MKSNHCKSLLIDCGNSYTKFAVLENGKLSEVQQSPSTSSTFEKFSTIDPKGITKVFILTNGRIEKELLLLKAKYAKAEFKIINKDDFKGLLDLSNVKSDVQIGNDILLLGYWANKQKDIKSVICLGTVYFSLTIINKQFKQVTLLPSFVKGLEQIEHSTSIPSTLIPTEFNNHKELNTPNAFASGLNCAMNGFVKEFINCNKIDKSQLAITGGDSNKYECLKKYNVIQNLTIIALADLIKDKKW